MDKYPLRYQLLDYLFDFLFSGILRDNQKRNETQFVRFAVVIQMLKMIAVAGVIAAAACIFVSQEAAVIIWTIASFFLMLIGSMVFTAH